MRLINKLVLAAVSVVAAAPAFAQEVNNFGNDYTSLTSKVDSGEIAKAVVLVGGLMVTPRLAMTGVRWVRGAIR